MPIVYCVTDLWRLFYDVHETLNAIVSNVFYVSFAGLALEGAGLGLGNAGLDYKTAAIKRNRKDKSAERN